MITAISSGLLVIDLKFTLIGLLENSDLDSIFTKVLGLDSNIANLFSNYLRLRSSISAFSLSASNSLDEVFDLDTSA